MSGGDGRAVVAGWRAAQPVVEAVAPDGVPQRVHAGAVEREQLLHGGDALGVEADLGARADAGQVAQFEMRDGARQLRGQQADEAVGLLHVAGDLGEVAVGRHADGAAQRLADVVLDGLLDGERDRAGARRLLLAAHQLADHLVDGGRVGDRAAALDGLGDLCASTRRRRRGCLRSRTISGQMRLASPTWVPVLMPSALAS